MAKFSALQQRKVMPWFLMLVHPERVIDTLVHKPTSDQISVYVVRQGDTLSQIAEMFDVSVNTIKWGNDLRSNTLKVETLVILPISGVKHTVAKGDTIVSLAKKYKGDADEIIALIIFKKENLGNRLCNYHSGWGSFSAGFYYKANQPLRIKRVCRLLYETDCWWPKNSGAFTDIMALT